MASRDHTTTGAATLRAATFFATACEIVSPYRPEYRCEYCDRAATADDWSYVAQAIVCPRCIEDFLANQEDRP